MHSLSAGVGTCRDRQQQRTDHALRSKNRRPVDQTVADWRTKEQIQANKPKRPHLGAGAFTRDANVLATSSEQNIFVWNLEKGTLQNQVAQPDIKGCRLSWNADATLLAVAESQYAGHQTAAQLRVVNPVTGETKLTLDPAGRFTSVIEYSPDGTKLFTGFGDGSALIWDARLEEAAE